MAGVERMFFLRRREGARVTLRELAASVPFFVGRFFRLGLLVGIASVPLFVLFFRLTGRHGPAAPHASAGW